MSRVGASPITLPASVSLTQEGGLVRVKGPRGDIDLEVSDTLNVAVAQGVVTLSVKGGEAGLTKHAASLWGLFRSLINNAVIGVSEGFTRVLEIKGVGYRAALRGKDLQLSLGFSHPVIFSPPEGVTLACPNQTTINVTGVDKQLVGQVAANIRRFRPPEPYKGKGVRYAGEYVRIKEGKKK